MRLLVERPPFFPEHLVFTWTTCLDDKNPYIAASEIDVSAEGMPCVKRQIEPILLTDGFSFTVDLGSLQS